MKKVTLLCGLLLALSASAAMAAPGVNLKWDNCFGDGGLTNKAFTCTTNNGTETLVAGFELGANLSQASGLEIVIDIATASASLPAWWQFKNAGTCRSGSLNQSVNPPATALACSDWAAGTATGAVAAYQVGLSGPNTARILEVTAVPASSLVDLFGGQEYFALETLINNQKTVGTGSCAGCTTPACIICNSIKVATPPVAGQPSRDVLLSGPTDPTGTSNYSTWQGGLGVIVQGKPSGCPQAVPTHTQTWSSVKSLYR